MKDGQMTTMMVHNMINSNKSSIQNKSNNQHGQIICMQYQQYTPSNYQTQIQQRIRSRSFYNQKTFQDNNYRNKSSKKSQNRFVSLNSPIKQAKIIDVEFQFFKRSKSKKGEQKKTVGSGQYYSLMVDSMQKYITKVENGKKKKKQKCQKIKYFGVDIKSIQYNYEHRRDLQFNRAIQSNKLDKSLYQKNITNKRLERFTENADHIVQIQKNHIFTLESPAKNTVKINSQNSKVMSQTLTTNLQRSKLWSKKISMRSSEKKDQQKGIGIKFDRMCNFLGIILSSYGVSLDRTRDNSIVQEIETKSKKKERYYYYIGKGNNKNLIASILRKRWWWAEADDMSSANFVWTQIKILTILCKQPSMNYSELQEARPELYKRNNSDKTLPTKSFSKIFHEDHSSRFYQKLSQKQGKKYLRSMKPPSVLHNHYEANYMLGNKKALFYNMYQYKSYLDHNPFEYIPLTFHVQKINSKAFKNFEKIARQQKKSLWIVKPGQNSNRGQGIFVADSIQKIKNKIGKNSKHTYIIQKYLKNNFTFQRRKFDIRTYLLMVSIGGVKKFFWYQEGYLRTSSEIYDLSDLDDPFIHLTNDAIQIHSQNYGKYEKGNKITYHQFQRYLDINYTDQKHSVPQLVQNMKNIAKQVVNATYFRLDPCRKQSGLELFGMDFFVDSQFKPWLLQVNTNPCLELSSPVLQRLIPRMLENLFRIAIDPIFQPPKSQLPRALACYIPDSLVQNNRFELIFDSLYDRNYAWQQFSHTNIKEEIYEDEDEEYDDDGEIVKIDY